VKSAAVDSSGSCRLLHVNATKAGLRSSCPVPSYHFWVDDGSEPDSGPVAVDCSDLAAARREAIRTAGEMLRDLGGEFRGQEWRMEVTDHTGRPLLRLRFRAEDLT